jgi:meso-butanediol dehydrogenase / (S,S)-butanediol dehydrogenase / diacetyl reductase
MRLQDKTAMVTGGATGIGQAIALRFAEEGASVTIADVNEPGGEKTAKEAGGLFVACDTSQPEEAAGAVASTVETFDGLDVLVNSAAHLGGYCDVSEMTEGEWRDVLAVTLDGVFHCSKYAVAEMITRGGGSVIHISSAEAITGVATHAAYVAGKSALYGLTRSMAIDFGKRGVRVNCISPGIIDAGRPDLEELKQRPEVMRFWSEMTVLARMGRPEEVAAAALFLASDESSYVTGQNLAVDGGWTIGTMPWPG